MSDQDEGFLSRAASATSRAGAAMKSLSEALEEARPALMRAKQVMEDVIVQQEWAVRERLGLLRFLSPTWWELRNYCKRMGRRRDG